MQLNELHAFCVYRVHGFYVFSMGFFISYLRQDKKVDNVEQNPTYPHFFRQTEVFAILMAMPETAVHKNDRAVFTQHQIRMTGQTWMVEPIAEATTKQELSHYHFGFSVFSFYR